VVGVAALARTHDEDHALGLLVDLRAGRGPHKAEAGRLGLDPLVEVGENVLDVGLADIEVAGERVEAVAAELRIKHRPRSWQTHVRGQSLDEGLLVVLDHVPELLDLVLAVV